MGDEADVKPKPEFEVIVGESLALRTTSRKSAFELAQFNAAEGKAVVLRKTVELFRSGGTV